MSDHAAVYCPSHLAVHVGAPWCTAGRHLALGVADPHAEARRLGLPFFHDDVENLRDSALDPLVGDVVGDTRCMASLGRFHRAFLREVVSVCVEAVEWKRPGGVAVTRASRHTWRTWARGSWRCSPETGEPTRRSWRPA